MKRGSAGASQSSGSSKGSLHCTVKLLDGSSFQLEVNVSLLLAIGKKLQAWLVSCYIELHMKPMTHSATYWPTILAYPQRFVLLL